MYGAREKGTTYSNVNVIELDQQKLDLLVGSLRSQKLLVLYDGFETEEQYSLPLYLKKPDIIQLLSINELKSTNLSRITATSGIEQYQDDRSRNQINPGFLQKIEQTWKSDTAEYRTLLDRELESIQRSDIVLVNSDFDDICLQELYSTKDMPLMISVPLFFDSSAFRPLLSEGSLLKSQTPYQTPVRRCSIQLMTDSSPTDLKNIGIFLSSVWPLVMEQTDTIRLDIMDMSGQSRSTTTKSKLQQSTGFTNPEIPEISLLDLCSKVPNVRVVSVSSNDSSGSDQVTRWNIGHSTQIHSKYLPFFSAAQHQVVNYP